MAAVLNFNRQYMQSCFKTNPKGDTEIPAFNACPHSY